MDGFWSLELLWLPQVSLRGFYEEAFWEDLCSLWKYGLEDQGPNWQYWRKEPLDHYHSREECQSTSHRSRHQTNTNQRISHGLPSLPSQEQDMHRTHRMISYWSSPQFLLLRVRNLSIMRVHLHLEQHYLVLNLGRWCHVNAILQ